MTILIIAEQLPDGRVRVKADVRPVIDTTGKTVRDEADEGPPSRPLAHCAARNVVPLRRVA